MNSKEGSASSDAESPKRSTLRAESSPDTAEIVRSIAEAIRGVRFGSVEVVIQDSRVVQIERKEKFRFDKAAGR
jgi:hypothetical protein